MAILTLMELPFQTDAQIKQESNLEAARFTIRAETPCLVYYRAIKVRIIMVIGRNHLHILIVCISYRVAS